MKIRKYLNMMAKLIIFTCLGCMLLILAAVLVMYSRHSKLLKEEAALLKTPGVLVEVDGVQHHIYIEGNESAEQTLVFLHGANQNDNAVAIEPLLDELQKDYKIVYIDREGNGYSAVGKTERTVENMTEETRHCLEKMEVKAPYVLVAENTAGLQAIYWQNAYPDEVTAIVGLNMAYPNQKQYVEEQDMDFTSKLMALYCKVGGHRSAYGVYPTDAYEIYSEKQMAVRNALISKGYFNKDACNEVASYAANQAVVSEIGFPREVSVLTIWNNPLMEPFYSSNEMVQQEIGELMKNNPDKDFVSLYNEENRKYFEDYQNVQFEEMAGPGELYTYNPEALSNAIKDFLAE